MEGEHATRGDIHEKLPESFDVGKHSLQFTMDEKIAWSFFLFFSWIQQPEKKMMSTL